jgi:hypothetical protein
MTILHNMPKMQKFHIRLIHTKLYCVSKPALAHTILFVIRYYTTLISDSEVHCSIQTDVLEIEGPSDTEQRDVVRRQEKQLLLLMKKKSVPILEPVDCSFVHYYK